MVNKKIMISVAAIGMFILSMFLAPIKSASAPYITVMPSSGTPGTFITVSGYNFPAGKTVNIYMDTVDNYHLLDAASVNLGGWFSFFFTMQSSYIGTHTIIAVGEYGSYPEYTAPFTLVSTNPLDQRLIDLIAGATSTFSSDISNAQSALETWMSANIKNTALTVQASAETQYSGTVTGTDIIIQVNRVDNGKPVVGLAGQWPGNASTPLGSIKTTFIDDTEGQTWTTTNASDTNVPFGSYYPPLGPGTYLVTVYPGTSSSPWTTYYGESAVFRIDVNYTDPVTHITYYGSTTATVVCD